MLSFVKIKPSLIGDITLSFTDKGKSCPVRDFFYVANVSFNAIQENKIITKNSEFTAYMYYERAQILLFYLSVDWIQMILVL